MFAAGCIFFELLSLHSFSDGSFNPITAIRDFFSIMGSPSETHYPELLKIPFIKAVL
jgi:hypothetical protein